jgi:integrase
MKANVWKEYVKEKRGTLSPQSVQTYASILKNLYLRVFKDDEIHFDLFEKEPEKVLDYLNGLPPNRRKTILSALVVITANDKYRKKMMEDIKDYNHEIGKQEKTETQKENWVNKDDITKIFDAEKASADFLFKKKTFTPDDLQSIQNFIILCLLSGKYIPPRRSLDFTEMVVKPTENPDLNTLDLKKKLFVFNRYKTAKTYGSQTLPIPNELVVLLRKWLKINPNEFLLFDTKGNKLNSVKLNQRFNAIFGKRVSVNAMRHSFLTEKYGDQMEKNKQIANTMGEMGSSSAMLTTYVKHE